MKKTEFNLGDKVEFSHVVEKQRVYGPAEDRWGYKIRYTKYSELYLGDYMKGEPLSLPKRSYAKLKPGTTLENPSWEFRDEIFSTGVVVGRRHVSDYKIHPGSYEEPTVGIMESGTTREVYLVAFNLHQKPVMVFPQHLKVITDESN